MISDDLREDLSDLRKAIESVDQAIFLDDPEAIALAKIDCLALIESLAVLHCSIVEHVLSDRRKLNRKMGVREVYVPIDFEGMHFVAKPRKPVELPK